MKPSLKKQGTSAGKIDLELDLYSKYLINRYDSVNFEDVFSTQYFAGFKSMIVGD